MLRLKTTKTKFCQLVADMAAALDWVKMPNRESIHFWKAYRQSDYFLEWIVDSCSYQAFLAPCLGRVTLSIEQYGLGRQLLHRQVFSPTLDEMKTRGMIEDIPQQ